VPAIGREAYLNAEGLGLLIEWCRAPWIGDQHATAAGYAHEVVIEREECRCHVARALADPAFVPARRDVSGAIAIPLRHENEA